MFDLLKRTLIPDALLSPYHFAWSWLSALLAGFPSRRLVVIGVTGTNGKSTVVWLAARLLEAAGYRVAAASSIEFQIADEHWPNTFKMTMPGRGYLQQFLRRAVAAGCTHAVIEVTSEGIRQHRHRFIDWDIAVFTNLSPEHIERHGSFEAYRAAKMELFRSLGRSSSRKVPSARMESVAIVNLGDREAPAFLHLGARRTIGFRLQGRGPYLPQQPPAFEELVAEHPEATPDGIRFSIRGIVCAAPLLGFFNIENALAAISVAYALGVPIEMCASGLRGIDGIPGRLEEIPSGRDIRIFVDYAHTPKALEAVYATLYDTLRTPKRRIAHLTCVLGAAGGGRDRWKRAELGRIAAIACDRIIVTDEDPYDEDPQAIRRAVIDGARAHGGASRIEEVPDRRLAIRRALRSAAPGGIVIITGKGCEPWMVVRHGEKIPWDDRAVVREEVAAFSREQRTRRS